MKLWSVSALFLLFSFVLFSCKDSNKESSKPVKTPEELAKDSLKAWVGRSLGFDLKNEAVALTFEEYDARKEDPQRILKGKEEFSVALLEKIKSTTPRMVNQVPTKPLVTLKLLYPNYRVYSVYSGEAVELITQPSTSGPKKGTVTLRHFYSALGANGASNITLWTAVIEIP